MKIEAFIFIAAAYLLGSIPSGILVARLLRLQDPRTAGSGNIGATNVLRLGGKTAGALTLAGDFAKGLIAVDLARFDGIADWALWSCAIAAVVGHVFSIFLNFRGGKGVATGLGVVVALWPWIGLSMLGLWLAAAGIFRYSSLAALIAFLALPAAVAWTTREINETGVGAVLTILILATHRENIRRLWQGTESKIGASRVKS